MGDGGDIQYFHFPVVLTFRKRSGDRTGIS